MCNSAGHCCTDGSSAYKTHRVDDDNESQPRLVRDFEQGELHHLVKVKQKVMYYRRL